MIEKVITGGQTGADQAAWRAAKAAGIATGGWMPPEFMTEDGPRMQFKVDFGAREIERDTPMIYPAGGTDWSVAYATRTRLNVRDSDATLWFGDLSSLGGRVTREASIKHKKPCWVVVDSPACPPIAVVGMIREHQWRLLNIAGNRESSAPGIGEWVERYLTEVFRLVKANGKA